MKKSLRSFGLFIYFALCIGIAYAFMYFAYDSHAVAVITLLVMIAAIFVAFVLNTFFHELGHLIFGFLTGYRFISFRLFHVMLTREDSKLVFQKYSLPGTLGQCLMAPPPYRGGTFPFMLYNLGGIIFGGTMSLVFIVLAVMIETYATIQIFCFMAGWIGLVLNFINAIPSGGKKSVNDGTNTHYAKKSLAARTALWNQLQYVALNAKGFRTKDMPDTLFSVPPIEELTNPLTVWQGIAALDRASDTGDFEKAKEICTLLREEANIEIPLYRAALASEALYLELVTTCDPDRVTVLYEEMKKFSAILKQRLSTHRVLYAYRLLHLKDKTSAGTAVSAFYKAIAKSPYRTEIEAESELMAHAKEISLARENESSVQVPPIPPNIIIEETSEEEENYTPEE